MDSDDGSPVRQPVAPQRFPFDIEFQKRLLKLLCDDVSFAHAAQKYLVPQYFEDQVLAWAYSQAQRYFSDYGTMPSLEVLLQKTREIDQTIRPLYLTTLEQLQQEKVRDEHWVKDQVLDFVQRNIYARSFKQQRDLYNAGKFMDAYDLMQRTSEEIRQATWDPIDREFFFEDLPRREAERLKVEQNGDAIGTGLGWLDNILNGGLSEGELGIWVAYPKTGKTTMLTNLGVSATRNCHRRTLHVVLEGSRKQVADRYESAFSEVLYGEIRRGNLTPNKHLALQREYNLLRHKLVIRGFTERWDYSAADIHHEMMELKRDYGWDPDLVIVDYGDLLNGREKSYRTETEKQRAAFRDIKSLANRGYAVWTASQAQRPRDGAEDTPQLLHARSIADCYDKVRVADFIGSLNATRLEKREKQMRLYAELYRDNAAEQELRVAADFSIMTIREKENLVCPHKAGAQSEPQPRTLHQRSWMDH